MEIGLIESGAVANVVECESLAVARAALPGFDAYIERKAGQSWGPGWAYAAGVMTGPDGQTETALPGVREISLNEFMDRLPGPIIDAILDMEANPVDAPAREVRRAMLRFRLAKNQTLELDAPLLLAFIPMLKAFGLTDEQVAAITA
jgi:hypothetical protein